MLPGKTDDGLQWKTITTTPRREGKNWTGVESWL
jgi:hypothetical protein